MSLTVANRLAAAGERAPDEALEAPRSAFRLAFASLHPGRKPPSFDIEFRPYASLRSSVRYVSSGGRIRARLSDLLRDAPREALVALATILLHRLYEEPVPAEASAAYDRWVYSAETQERLTGIRRARSRRKVRPARGRAHDLDAMFDSLNGRYFGESLRKPALGWSERPSRKRLGDYDPAHDMIVVSSVLDRNATPAVALEYVLYHEMLHLKHPPRLGPTGRRVHTPEFLAEERRFAGYEDARRILRAL